MQARSTFRRDLVLVLSLSASALYAGDRSALKPIPWPDDPAMEPAIQEQLRAVRAVLEPMTEQPEESPADLAEAYGTAGQVYLVYSLVDSALASLYNAATLAPNDFRWNFYLGRTFQEDGDGEAAALYLGRAHALRPTDLPALIRLAQSELSRDELEAASRHFQGILDLDPGNAPAHFGLGRIAYKRRDLERSIRHFEAALEAQPDASAIHYPLALAYRDLGDAEKARAHLARRGPQAPRFDEPLMQQLRSFVRGGSLLVYSATHARAAGDLDGAIAGFSQALEIDPTNNAARLNLASTMIQKRDLEAARRVLEEALRYDPQNSSAHYNLGLVLDQAGQTQAALTHLQQAAELAPDFVDAHLNYGLLLQESGRLVEAEAQFAVATRLDPTDAEIRFRHAGVLLQLQQIQRAMDELELALDIFPDSVDGHLLMARAQAMSGAYRASAASFARVLELEPDHRQARFARALSLLLADQYREALQHLEASLTRDPGDLAIRHILARLLATCPDAAIRDGERALALAQEVIAARLTIDHAQTVAMALAELGRFDEATALQLQIIEQASRTTEAAPTADLRRHLELYQSGQPVRAPWRLGDQ